MVAETHPGVMAPTSPMQRDSAPRSARSNFLSLLLATSAITFTMSTQAEPSIESKEWGNANGQPVKLYTLKNAKGLLLKVTDYGAIITELHVPDRNGKMADIVLGHDSLDGYLAGHPFFGTIAGRCANRIAKGHFELDGKSYQLATNNGVNHLHGGIKGFDKQVWNARTEITPEGPAIHLGLYSPDGQENYPGNLVANATYTLSNDGELLVEMTAMTDRATLCNLAQHTYWNLAGHDTGSIANHELRLFASRYTPVDGTLIPTGELAPVKGTPFDFTSEKPIGRDLKAAGGDPVGFDHNFVVDGESFAMKQVARACEPKSGRTLELWSNQPGVQFYTGNFLNGTNKGKGGYVYQQHGGFCLETQVYPDSIHRPDWPTPVLRPGQVYRHQMRIKFGTK